MLLNRAQFCPIGKITNTKMLPDSFVRICMHHQTKAEGVNGWEGAPMLSSVACSECPVGPHIKKGVDPVSIVADVQWFTLSEISEITSQVHRVIGTVKKFKGYKASTRKGVSPKMKDQLKRINVLLSEIVTIVDSMTKELENSTIDKLVSAPVESKHVVPVLLNDIDYSTAKDFVNMKEETFTLASAVYNASQKGVSTKEIARAQNKSPKYIGALLKKYKDCVTHFSAYPF